MNYYIALVVLVYCALSINGCDNESDIPILDSSILVYQLYPRLVIGEDDINTQYTLSAIADADFLPDGRIAILDRFECGALVFSHSGEYLYTIGRHGEGPGEFINPNSLACIKDKIVIFDQWAYRASLFDQQGNYIGELTDSWSTNPPSFVCFASESTLVAGITSMDNPENVYDINYMVNLLNMDFEVVDTLFQNNFIYEPGNLTQMLQMSLFSCSFSADGMGNVFLAITSPDTYEIHGWNLSGEEFLSITKNREPVEKSEDELLRESERITSMIEARNPGITHNYTPILFKYQIPPNGVHADGLGRIWVLDGFSDLPEFDVYSYEGELLFSVQMLGIDSNEIQEVLWWEVSKHGLLVFSRDPFDYPKVWVYDYPEI